MVLNKAFLVHVYESDPDKIRMVDGSLKTLHSLAKCTNFCRGIALWQLREELKRSDRPRKTILNIFTSYQRTDRTLGSNFEKSFLKKYELENASSVEEIENKTGTATIILNSSGFISYISNNIMDPNRQIIGFLSSSEMLYLITNMKGLCRKDKNNTTA